MIKKCCLGLMMLFLLISGLTWLWSPQVMIPVQEAGTADWNDSSFWYYPWGRSVTHKGVDIFAEKGKPVLSSTDGLVIQVGENAYGGRFMVVLGPRMTFHYYAHLQDIYISKGDFLQRGEKIASVGNTGNAVNKPPHLHYTILTWLPRFGHLDAEHQAFRKLFYLDPIPLIKGEYTL